MYDEPESVSAILPVAAEEKKKMRHISSIYKKV